MDDMILHMSLLPFWTCLDIQAGRPTVDSMVALLELNSLKAPRSGSACLQLLWANKTIISCEPLPPPLSEPLLSEPLSSLPLEPHSEPPSEQLPLIDQCEDGIRSEAEERLKTCLESSFKTDNGRIMLENDLLLFENSEGWIQEMIQEWHPRLNSAVHNEFTEAIHLWILSHEPIEGA